MNLVVLDASVAVRLYVAHPDTKAAQQLLIDCDCISPALMRLEMANAMRRYVQAGIVSPADARHALAHAEQAIRIVPETPVLVGSALALGLEYSHSVYDCCYLALAQAENAGLATADRKLAALARRLGVQVQTLGDAASLGTEPSD